jgi:hypothetical protein
MLAAILSGLAGCDSQPAAHAQPVPHVTAWMSRIEPNQRRLRGRSDWQARGGALQTLGKQKLERIRERSALSNLDTVMLAQKLDADNDLVSCATVAVQLLKPVLSVLVLHLLLLLVAAVPFSQAADTIMSCVVEQQDSFGCSVCHTGERRKHVKQYMQSSESSVMCYSPTFAAASAVGR